MCTSWWMGYDPGECIWFLFLFFSGTLSTGMASESPWNKQHYSSRHFHWEVCALELASPGLKPPNHKPKIKFYFKFYASGSLSQKWESWLIYPLTVGNHYITTFWWRKKPLHHGKVCIKIRPTIKFLIQYESSRFRKKKWGIESVIFFFLSWLQLRRWCS